MAEAATELPPSSEAPSADQAEQSPAQPAAKNIKKRKYAVFLGYLGAGYHVSSWIGATDLHCLRQLCYHMERPLIQHAHCAHCIPLCSSSTGVKLT